MPEELLWSNVNGSAVKSELKSQPLTLTFEFCCPRKWLTNPMRKLSQGKMERRATEKSSKQEEKVDRKMGKFTTLKVRGLPSAAVFMVTVIISVMVTDLPGQTTLVMSLFLLSYSQWCHRFWQKPFAMSMQCHAIPVCAYLMPCMQSERDDDIN